MNIWGKSILTGLAATAASLLFVVIAQKKNKGLFSSAAKLYTAHYYLKLLQPGEKISKNLTDSTIQTVSNELKQAGFKANVITNDKQELDAEINDIVQADTSLIDLLLTNKSNVEVYEVYSFMILKPVFGKLAGVALKYLPNKRKEIPSLTIKKIDPVENNSEGSKNQLKEFESEDITPSDQTNGYNPIDSIISFNINPYPDARTGNLRFPAEIGYLNTKDTA